MSTKLLNNWAGLFSIAWMVGAYAFLVHAPSGFGFEPSWLFMLTIFLAGWALGFYLQLRDSDEDIWQVASARHWLCWYFFTSLGRWSVRLLFQHTVERCGLTNRCRQRGMASLVPLRGSRWLVPRA
jgi:hypothetical protein